MKILWVVNIPFGPLCELAGSANLNSGSWLDASYEALKNVDNIELIIVTTGMVKKMKCHKDGRHTFCLIPGGAPKNYNHKSAKNKEVWNEIYKLFKPDLIHCWGTEFSHGLLALQVMTKVPSVIYMQGVVSQIGRYYTTGMSVNDLFKSITIRDLIKLDWIQKQKIRFLNRAKVESDIIKLSGNVIVENNWCKGHCDAIAEGVKAYFSKLNIKEEFFNYKRQLNSIEEYSLMTVSPGVPYKGLHIMLKAFYLVLKRYPKSKLYVAGMDSPLDRGLKRKLLRYGYASFIRKLILRYGIYNNVVFMGRIDSISIADRMARSNIFILPSSIENHSSALIEAMIIGVPCISSNVGGISEFLRHDENGLLYRFEEFEILASHVCRLFSNSNITEKLGRNASNEMKQLRQPSAIQNELLSIYESILAQVNK